jgi:hypothetical protein
MATARSPRFFRCYNPTVRYWLSDEEADPARLLRARTASYRIAEVAGGEGGAAAVLQNFVHGLRAHHLPVLRAQTERGAGFGTEIASSMYDDDLEPDDEPFEGVLVSSNILQDEVVLSRTSYKRFVDALLAFPLPGE